MSQDILEEAKEFYNKAMLPSHGEKFLNTAQLRNFYNEVIKIKNRIEAVGDNCEEWLKIQNSIDFLDIKLMYQVGRARDEKKWDNNLHPIEKFYIKGQISKRIEEAKQSPNNYKKFADLMEAIVALHKFYGGKNK